MKKELKIYEGWKDITLGQMQEIEKIAKENSKENGIFHSNWYFSETDLGFGEFKCRCV